MMVESILASKISKRVLGISHELRFSEIPNIAENGFSAAKGPFNLIAWTHTPSSPTSGRSWVG
jgi:hypothetical protein